MVKLFTDLAEDYDNFFKDNYVVADGFKVKAKAKDFAGEVKLNGGKASLKGKLEFENKLDDYKFEHTATVKSDGKHTFESKCDVSKLFEKTKVTKTINLDSNTHDYDVQVSTSNTSVEKTKFQLDLQYFRNGNWTATAHAARKLCGGMKLSNEITYDGANKELNNFRFGVLFKPTKFAQSFVTYTHEGKIDSAIKPWQAGVLEFRQRFKASSDTKLGFDYSYSLGDKTSSTTFGIDTNLSEGVDVRGKVDAAGKIETSATLKINSGWKLTIGAATHASHIGGKQEAQIGVGLEGKL